MGQIYIGHVGVHRKGHFRGIRRDIGPVGLKDVASFFGNAYPHEHLLAGYGDNPHQVVILEQHLDLLGRRGFIVASSEPVNAVVQHSAQLHDGGHRLPRAGDLTLHLVDEVLHTGGHRNIEAVGICGDRAERFVCRTPLDIELVLILHQLAHRAEGAALFAVAHLAQLVQGGLKLVLASFEAGCTAAGQIVLFQYQHLFALGCEVAGCGKTAVTCADNNYIVFLHCVPPPF